MTELQVPRYKAFAVVPVKRLADAKQRLGGALSADLRQRLVKTMLGDVLDQLRQTPGIEQVIVVSRDPDVANLARERAVRTVIEPEGSDLNAAIAFGLEAARKSGARRGLIVPGDVPLALAADFSELLAAADGPELSAIAPSLDGDGTNALLVPLPMPFKPLFGPASAARHQAAARKAGLRMAVVASDRIGRDIDTCEDLAVYTDLDARGALDAFVRLVEPNQ